MNFVERIASWLGFDANAIPNPDDGEIRRFLDEGREFKRREAYTDALDALGRALALADKQGRTALLTLINLHRADVYTKQQQYDQAQSLLNRMQADTLHHQAEQSYILSALGVLAQTRNRWDTASEFYERALKTARQANANGAEARAMGHLADVYLHEGNASYGVHLLREALPKLNDSGDTELSSYFVGRLGQALIASGQAIEGKQLLERALRLAENTDYRIYLRMWHQALGDLELQESRYVDAYNHYERCLQLMPDNAAEMLPVLRAISKTCLYLNKNEDALAYARRALEQNPESLHTRGVLGVVLQRMGFNDEALPHLESAATQDVIDVEIWRTLATAQASLGQVDQSYATFDRALKAAQKQDNRLEEARTHRDIGLLHAEQMHMADAIKSLSAALIIYDEQEYHEQVARMYCDIANMRLYLGQGQRAMKDYEQALMRLGSIHDWETRGVVLSNAATAYVDQGDIETAEAFFSESIKIAQRLHDTRAEATRRGNYGWFLLVTDRLHRALPELETAVRRSADAGMPLHVAVQTSNVGLAHGLLGHHDQALDFHRNALRVMQEVGSAHWIAIIQINLANELLHGTTNGTGKPHEAALSEAHTLLASALASARQREDSEAVIRSLIGLSTVESHRGQLEAAGKHAQEAVALARRAHSNRLLAESLVVCSQWRAASGDHDRARELWDEAQKLLKMLHHPQAQTTPDWLQPVSGS